MGCKMKKFENMMNNVVVIDIDSLNMALLEEGFTDEEIIAIENNLDSHINVGSYIPVARIDGHYITTKDNLEMLENFYKIPANKFRNII
jgi:hypothetical protein